MSETHFFTRLKSSFFALEIATKPINITHAHTQSRQHNEAVR